MSHSISLAPPKLAAVGAAAGAAGAATEATGAGAAAAAGAGAAAAAASTSSNKEPSATLSPTFTFNSLTTPALLEGISMLALSDSTVISDWSTLMVSPTLTSNSITSTSLKSPISGTLTSKRLMYLLRYIRYWLTVAPPSIDSGSCSGQRRSSVLITAASCADQPARRPDRSRSVHPWRRQRHGDRRTARSASSDAAQTVCHPRPA